MWYQIFDMGNVALYSDSDNAWNEINPDYFEDEVIYLYKSRWIEFVKNAKSGDCFIVSHSVYVVKLGKDWNQ